MTELAILEMFCNRTTNRDRWFYVFEMDVNTRDSYPFVSFVKAIQNGWIEHNGHNKLRLTLDGIIKGVEEGYSFGVTRF